MATVPQQGQVDHVTFNAGLTPELSLYFYHQLTGFGPKIQMLPDDAYTQGKRIPVSP